MVLLLLAASLPVELSQNPCNMLCVSKYALLDKGICLAFRLIGTSTVAVFYDACIARAFVWYEGRLKVLLGQRQSVSNARRGHHAG